MSRNHVILIFFAFLAACHKSDDFKVTRNIVNATIHDVEVAVYNDGEVTEQIFLAPEEVNSQMSDDCFTDHGDEYCLELDWSKNGADSVKVIFNEDRIQTFCVGSNCGAQGKNIMMLFDPESYEQMKVGDDHWEHVYHITEDDYQNAEPISTGG